MAKMSNGFKSNPLYQLKDVSLIAQPYRIGDGSSNSDIAFVSNQRQTNHLKTASQTQSYAANKAMSEQGRTDMRGNVAGYSDTMG